MLITHLVINNIFGGTNMKKMILLVLAFVLAGAMGFGVMLMFSTDKTETNVDDAKENVTEEATEEEKGSSEEMTEEEKLNEEYKQKLEALTSGPKPVVTIEMESGDKIVVELYPEVAPNTVNNFISLVNDGYYDGLIYHRVIDGFMIQGGCPLGTGTGDPGYSIEGEFTMNGIENILRHDRGVISMARAQAPDSGGSQFFIMHADSPFLDGNYAAFGKVTSGLEVVDAIATTERDGGDRPVAEQKMKTVTVELNGYEAAEPNTL